VICSRFAPGFVTFRAALESRTTIGGASMFPFSSRFFPSCFAFVFPFLSRFFLGVWEVPLAFF
jgi:hypothetical protein